MKMRSTSRRSFLTTAAAATAASLHARALATVGVQLYTVRTVLPPKSTASNTWFARGSIRATAAAWR